MKRTWRIIPFAALAAAVMLAAACSDDPTGELSGQGESTESADGAGRQYAAITADDVLALIQEIDYIDGNTSWPHPNTYWDFAATELSEDNGGLVAIIPWTRSSIGAQFPPYIYHTLNKLQLKGKVSTSLLSVDLSKAEWDEYEEGDKTGRTQTEIMSSGYRYATVTIELAEGVSAELPEELGAITIAFDSDGIVWKDIPSL